MRRRLLAALGTVVTSTSLAWSQTPAPMPAPATPAIVTPESRVLVDSGAVSGASDSPQIWGGAEYMMWWVRSAHVPLVTTGDPVQAAAVNANVGTLFVPGTAPLNSGKQDYGKISGTRLSAGAWLDAEHTVGFEASGFLMEQRSSSFGAASDAAGNPFIAIPAISTPPTTTTNQENAQTFAAPGLQAGVVHFTTTLNMWGTEANGLFAVRDSGPIRARLLAGFRYMDISENLSMNDSTSILGLGFPVSFTFHDDFQTRNQIFAGQIGGQVEGNYGRFFVNLTGKLGFGWDHATENVAGSTSVMAPPALVFVPPIQPVSPGGLFASNTNFGRQSGDDFVFMPEVQLKVGMNVGQHLRVFAGYELLYISSVVRPGDQIDRTINGSQGFGQPLVGQPRPAPMFNHSDMWMQGVSGGLEIRF